MPRHKYCPLKITLEACCGKCAVGSGCGYHTATSRSPLRIPAVQDWVVSGTDTQRPIALGLSIAPVCDTTHLSGCAPALLSHSRVNRLLHLQPQRCLCSSWLILNFRLFSKLEYCVKTQCSVLLLVVPQKSNFYTDSQCLILNGTVALQIEAYEVAFFHIARVSCVELVRPEEEMG